MDSLKQKLHKACLEYVQRRIDNALQAADAAREAVYGETKSSAGDKYETGRAMAQQETNRNLVQLQEAQRLKSVLNAIPANSTSLIVMAGSVVATNNGNFYLAISAGSITLDEGIYTAISIYSPIGSVMKGKQCGDDFSFNGKNYRIESVL